MNNEKSLRHHSYDAIIALIEIRFHYLLAFIAYISLKKYDPTWQMPKWEKYMLFPTSFIFDTLFKNNRKK